MVVDASAIIALIEREPGFKTLLAKAVNAADLIIGAPTLLEATIVAIGRLGPKDGKDSISEALKELGPVIVPFDGDLYKQAVVAVERFGKGRHPASLNFGDCMVYALAKSTGMQILCAGDGFAKTDISVA